MKKKYYFYMFVDGDVYTREVNKITFEGNMISAEASCEIDGEIMDVYYQSEFEGDTASVCVPTYAMYEFQDHPKNILKGYFTWVSDSDKDTDAFLKKLKTVYSNLQTILDKRKEQITNLHNLINKKN